jgi:molecular chaperone GrpE
MTDADPMPQPEIPSDVPENVVPLPDPQAGNKTAELEKKLADTQDKMLRALAEAQNTRNRAEKERQDTAKFAVSSLCRDLLSVTDNLRRAIGAVSPDARGKTPELNGVLTGVEATERALLRVLESNGVKPVEAMGKPFDPNLHEVMFEMESNQPAGTVVQVIETGYTIHDRLLRPARVGVAKGGENGGHVDQQA